MCLPSNARHCSQSLSLSLLLLVIGVFILHRDGEVSGVRDRSGTYIRVPQTLALSALSQDTPVPAGS